MRLAFVTNNASRTPVQVAELLHRVGVPAEPDEVVTSAQAAAHYLADRLPAGAAVLVLGTTGLIEALIERGLRPVFSAERGPGRRRAGLLSRHRLARRWPRRRWRSAGGCRGWPPTSTPPCRPRAGRCRATDRWWRRCGTRPVATPAATGKPDPAMHAESVERSGARHPIVVGDRLDTDIEGARRSDCASLLVLTGVTDPAGCWRHHRCTGRTTSAATSRRCCTAPEVTRSRPSWSAADRRRCGSPTRSCC